MDKIVYNIKNKTLYNKKKYTKKDMIDIIANNSLQLLGLRIICNNYEIDKDHNDYIETLAIDTNFQLVLVEYRMGKFTRVIKNGLMQIDYINSHISEFKILINDILKEDAKNVIYNPRLVIIGESFNKLDGDSISHLPYEIDLISLDVYDNDMISLNKIYTSRNVDLSFYSIKLNDNEKDLIFELNDFVLSFGEEISIQALYNIIVYRKIKTFMYVIYHEGLNVLLDGKLYPIKNSNDISKLENLIEAEYDK